MPANSQSPTASVKLFPRLATSKRIRRGLPLSDPAESHDHRRAHVRARLLHMILDNEQARRNDRRPTAG
jgi:hypothetical protein